MGKGSRRRPPQVSRRQIDENWDQTFSKTFWHDKLRSQPEVWIVTSQPIINLDCYDSKEAAEEECKFRLRVSGHSVCPQYVGRLHTLETAKGRWGNNET